MLAVWAGLTLHPWLWSPPLSSADTYAQASATLFDRKLLQSFFAKIQCRQRQQSPALMSHASAATFFATTTSNAVFTLTFGGHIFSINHALNWMRNLSLCSHGSTCDSRIMTMEDTGTTSSFPSSLGFTLLGLALLEAFRRYGTLAKGQV